MLNVGLAEATPFAVIKGLIHQKQSASPPDR